MLHITGVYLFYLLQSIPFYKCHNLFIYSTKFILFLLSFNYYENATMNSIMPFGVHMHLILLNIYLEVQLLSDIEYMLHHLKC